MSPWASKKTNTSSVSFPDKAEIQRRYEAKIKDQKFGNQMQFAQQRRPGESDLQYETRMYDLNNFQTGYASLDPNDYQGRTNFVANNWSNHWTQNYKPQGSPMSRQGVTVADVPNYSKEQITGLQSARDGQRQFQDQFRLAASKRPGETDAEYDVRMYDLQKLYSEYLSIRPDDFNSLNSWIGNKWSSFWGQNYKPTTLRRY